MKKMIAETLEDFININENKVIKKQKEIPITPQDVDPKEYLIGIEVEKQIHSESLAVCKILALQNLGNNPKFYSEAIKKGLIDNVAVINLYKKYFINKENPGEWKKPE